MSALPAHPLPLNLGIGTVVRLEFSAPRSATSSLRPFCSSPCSHMFMKMNRCAGVAWIRDLVRNNPLVVDRLAGRSIRLEVVQHVIRGLALTGGTVEPQLVPDDAAPQLSADVILESRASPEVMPAASNS